MVGVAWTYLIIAGLFEIDWPVGLKIDRWGNVSRALNQNSFSIPMGGSRLG